MLVKNEKQIYSDVIVFNFCLKEIFTCMAAHTESFGIVLIKPNSDRRRKRSPGAKRSTFIFTDTAKLSEKE